MLSVARSLRTSSTSSVRRLLVSRTRERTILQFRQAIPLTSRRDRQFWQAYNKVSFDPFTNLRINAAFLWTPTQPEGILPAFSGYGEQARPRSCELCANQNRGTFCSAIELQRAVDWTVTPTTLLSGPWRAFLGQLQVAWRSRP